MKIKDFIATLEQEFEINRDEQIALEQKRYLKDRFEHFGIKTPQRRELQKPFFEKAFLPSKQEMIKIVHLLWEKPEREFQYFSQELAFKYKKQPNKNDIQLFEYMVTHKSWWDTVDFIAVKLMGNYFKTFPDEKKTYVNKWIVSNNMWLQRSALLFQLKYKSDLDVELLHYAITSLLPSKEFFINKAIGWTLREYSRTNRNWVEEFVDHTKLSPLSKKEALRLIN